MKIVAFMQNPWFPAGTAQRHVERYNTDQEFHRYLLEGTMSGRRLKQAFKTLFHQIYWDNVAPTAADVPAGITEASPEWVDKVIREQQPDIILTFGTLAKEVLTTQALVPTRAKMFHCHHPNARHKTQADLDAFAGEVYHYIVTHPSTRRSIV